MINQELRKKRLEPLKITGDRRHERDDDDDKFLFDLDPSLLDEAKILQSKALRRLEGKTQVHSLRFNSHLRNRLIHTHEVVAVSVEIAYLLGLNVDFCRAAALGHDVGHVPFGHNGERVLGINHALNGAVVLQEVERKGTGLNLTRELVEAILGHSRNNESLYIDKRQPDEMNLIVFADKIAYLFADFDDFMRVGMLDEKDMPEELREFSCGSNFRRGGIAACVSALVTESLEKEKISFSESVTAKKFQEIRDWAFVNLYHKLDETPERIYQRENLKKTLEYFENESLSSSLDPRFAVSLMTDQEVN